MFRDAEIYFLRTKVNMHFTSNSSIPQAIKRARELHNMAAAPPTVLPEYKLWEEHWCRCSHELGQWDTLNEFGKSHNGAKPFLGQDLMHCRCMCVHVCAWS